MSQQAFINLALSNAYLFPNARAGDLGVLTGTNTQAILVGVSNTQSVLRITSSNITTSNINLGVNKADPAYPIDVTGDINFSGILRSGGVPYVGSQWSNNASNVFILTSNVGIQKSNPAFPLDVNGDLNFSGTLRQGGVPYVGSQWSNNASNVFILTSNVGIQKSNPAFPLDVNGDLNFSGTLRQGGVPYVGSQWSNNSSNVFLFSSNVGIGLSNPQAQLHLSSNLRVDGALNINQSLALSGLQFTMTGQLQNSTQVYAYTSNIQGLSNLTWGPSNGIQFSLPSSSSNDLFRFSTPSSNLMTIRGNGDVTVAGNLALSNNLRLNGFVVTQRASSIINNVSTSTQVPYTVTAAGSAQFAVASNNSNTNFQFLGAASEVARLTGNGKLGVGTTNPQYPLDVNGDINFTGSLLQAGTVYPKTTVLHTRIVNNADYPQQSINADYPINFIAENEIGIPNLISNTSFTLPVGTYEIHATLNIGSKGNRMNITLFNVTDNVDIKDGSTTFNVYSNPPDTVFYLPITIFAKFTITASKTFKYKVWSNTQPYSVGYGSYRNNVANSTVFDLHSTTVIKKLA